MRLNDRIHTIDHPVSYYSATQNNDRRYPALEGDVDVDICIAGGGLTGLSAAIHALEKGYRVALVEQCRIGWGASGRNGGQLLGGSVSGVRRSSRKNTVRKLGSRFGIWGLNVSISFVS